MRLPEYLDFGANTPTLGGLGSCYTLLRRPAVFEKPYRYSEEVVRLDVDRKRDPNSQV